MFCNINNINIIFFKVWMFNNVSRDNGIYHSLKITEVEEGHKQQWNRLNLETKYTGFKKEYFTLSFKKTDFEIQMMLP